MKQTAISPILHVLHGLNFKGVGVLFSEEDGANFQARKIVELEMKKLIVLQCNQLFMMKVIYDYYRSRNTRAL